MKRKNRIIALGMWMVLLGRSLSLAAQEKEPVTEKVMSMGTPWAVASVAFLLMVVGMFGCYMFYLQKKFLEACREDKQLPMFFDKPAGLPKGSIRSILTMMIIIFSLYVFVISLATGIEFPQALSAVLSVIIGFYFGNRSASVEDKSLTNHLKEKLGHVQAEKDESKAGQIIRKVNKNVKLLKTVLSILPKEKRKQYEPLLNTLETGTKAAEALMGTGAFGDAAKKVEKLYETFKKENPLKSLVSKASVSFAAVASGVPPLAIVGVIVAGGAVLAGVSYSRWKARILNMPFSPGAAPLKSVDADTGYALLMDCPVLKAAFEKQLRSRDGVFLEKAMTDFFSRETDDLWSEYGNQYPFDSYEAFEEGIQQFRMLAATDQVEQEVDPALFGEVGGYQNFMTIMDQLRENNEAAADLDLLVETVDSLKKTDEPIVSIFEKVKKEVEQQ